MNLLLFKNLSHWHNILEQIINYDSRVDKKSPKHGNIHIWLICKGLLASSQLFQNPWSFGFLQAIILLQDYWYTYKTILICTIAIKITNSGRKILILVGALNCLWLIFLPFSPVRHHPGRSLGQTIQIWWRDIVFFFPLIYCKLISVLLPHPIVFLLFDFLNNNFYLNSNIIYKQSITIQY